jgi:asparagine synthase (glutamine-hydrolysing)
VLWRTKEAFSDGVSTEKEAWFETIQRYALEHYKESCYECEIYNFKEITPSEAEKYLYKSIFDKYYSGNNDIIPYMWMPKFVEATDASARTLDVYSNNRYKTTSKAT